jgi:hypothetical protein
MSHIHIIEPNDSFDFKLLHLSNPSSVPGSAYFTKLYHSGKPLYIQTPKSYTKNGFVKNGKKIYSELMFDNNETEFIRWLENLEIRCQELILEKGDEWFQEKMEKSDIESAFTSPIKIYRSGKNYLVRTNIKVNSATNIASIKIYNENEVTLQMDDITNDKQIISVVEIQGIKFTSRSFQIEIEMKQVMLLDNEILFDKCVIQSVIKPKTIIDTNTNTNLDVTNDLLLSSDTKCEIDLPEILSNNNHNYDENEPLEIINKEIIEQDNAEQDVDSDEEDEEYKSSTKYRKNINNLEKDDQTTPSEFSDISEVDLEVNIAEDPIKLKDPREVYYEIYRLARKKARKLKHQALLAFLEAKNIKNTYMLEDLEEDDSVISELDFKHIEEILNYNTEDL